MDKNCSRTLQGKVILITGASSGIGRATALLAARAGGRIACCGRSPEKLGMTLDVLPGIDHASYLFDSTDLPGIEAMAASVSKEMGPVGGVVHSAGIAELQLLRDLDYSLTTQMFQINYMAFLALVKGVCRRGRYDPSGMGIVGVSSMAGLSPDAGLSAYAATKAALNATVTSLAKEYAPRKIRFNTVCPAYVNTPMNDGLKAAIGDDAFHERAGKNMPLGLIEPEEVAETICFLLSDAGQKITGAHLVMSAGATTF